MRGEDSAKEGVGTLLDWIIIDSKSGKFVKNLRRFSYLTLLSLPLQKNSSQIMSFCSINGIKSRSFISRRMYRKFEHTSLMQLA